MVVWEEGNWWVLGGGYGDFWSYKGLLWPEGDGDGRSIDFCKENC
jgi:hypothetical protein